MGVDCGFRRVSAWILVVLSLGWCEFCGWVVLVCWFDVVWWGWWWLGLVFGLGGSDLLVFGVLGFVLIWAV